MIRNRFVAVLPAVVLAACSRGPDFYAPPVQREPLEASQPSFVGPFVAMADPNADAYIVRDVSKAVEANAWRWAFRRPELQFYLKSAENQRFVMEFAVADVTFAGTGPVTLAVSVNGNELRKQRCDKPGQYKMEVPVPPAMLKPAALNRVAIEPDRVWISKQDGTALGFIISAAGFRQ